METLQWLNHEVDEIDAVKNISIYITVTVKNLTQPSVVVTVLQ